MLADLAGLIARFTHLVITRSLIVYRGHCCLHHRSLRFETGIALESTPGHVREV
jgi:hypothetical protein